MADNSLYNMYMDTADSFEAVNTIVRMIAPVPLGISCSSGTTSVSFEEQRKDVYSRDVIVEKTGFRTQTQRKYFQDTYYDKPVNLHSYGQFCITGTTQIWQEYIV